MKGLIALDIDGTLTADIHSIPLEVVRYLERLVSEGWQICLITGRCYAMASFALEALRFPYHLAVQNGAIILDMHSKKICHRQYLDVRVISSMERICEGEPTDFIVYTGMENQDICYYRPKCFDSQILQYIEQRAVSCKENWEPVDSFDELSFPSITAMKCIGPIDVVERISERVKVELKLQVPVIRDPLGENIFVAQATHPEVNKGGAVRNIKRLLNLQGPVIAAGDDHNDRSMLEEADFKIVMESAPKELREIADLVAAPAEERGVISALEQAIKLKGA
ncbi:MAG: Phosphatase YwpJ [Chlamydiae bacterium]|nr:Phosphatase YwpJ [Chlamydiota bacterium]